ncbi:hypothetical protein BDW62DRAFT_206671 [Aspergillus aurantiobrunneus]
MSCIVNCLQMDNDESPQHRFVSYEEIITLLATMSRNRNNGSHASTSNQSDNLMDDSHAPASPVRPSNSSGSGSEAEAEPPTTIQSRTLTRQSTSQTAPPESPIQTQDYLPLPDVPPSPAQTTSSTNPLRGTSRAPRTPGRAHSPPLIFPSPPPAIGTENVYGFADSASGIAYHTLGEVREHLHFPLIVQVRPNRGEARSFEPVTLDDLQIAEDHYFGGDGPFPRPGDLAPGWWATRGRLMWGTGRVVRVFQDVRAAWVEEYASE